MCYYIIIEIMVNILYKKNEEKGREKELQTNLQKGSYVWYIMSDPVSALK